MNPQQQWQDVKEAYLKQIEKYLAEVDHPRRPEILRDVQKHMEEKFRELPAELRNWDNCQRIVTEMGPRRITPNFWQRMKRLSQTVENR
jgi:hypothetical protein